MKKQIRKTILKIGIVKYYQANLIIKELLGDESAANEEYEKDVLDHVNIAAEPGEEVILTYTRTMVKHQSLKISGW